MGDDFLLTLLIIERINYMYTYALVFNKTLCLASKQMLTDGLCWSC